MYRGKSRVAVEVAGCRAALDENIRMKTKI